MGGGCICSALSITTSSSSSGKVINNLLQRTPLTQSYCALRHGQSLANVAKIISSNPTISTIEHGLSDVGKDQARVAGEAFASEYIGMMQQKQSNKKKYKGVAIFSSDFTRARETASIFANELRNTKQIPLYTGDIILEERLRERYFGVLNGGPDTVYQEVWDIDFLSSCSSFIVFFVSSFCSTINLWRHSRHLSPITTITPTITNHRWLHLYF